MFDGRGLYIEISPAGGRWWRFKYRIGGKEKRLSFGVYPNVSLKVAREKLEGARKHLEGGRDPGALRKPIETISMSKVGNRALDSRITPRSILPYPRLIQIDFVCV
jgi:hypothetical protein